MDRHRLVVIFLVALMIPLSGCVSNGDDGAQGNQGEQGLPESMAPMEATELMELTAWTV